MLKKPSFKNWCRCNCLNNNNKIFVGKRKDNPIDKWQMPQGGV